MQLIEPIIIAKTIESQIGQATPTDVVQWLVRIGYSVTELKSQKVFEAALKDLINQIKYN